MSGFTSQRCERSRLPVDSHVEHACNHVRESTSSLHDQSMYEEITAQKSTLLSSSLHQKLPNVPYEIKPTYQQYKALDKNRFYRTAKHDCNMNRRQTNDDFYISHRRGNIYTPLRCSTAVHVAIVACVLLLMSSGISCANSEDENSTSNDITQRHLDTNQIPSNVSMLFIEKLFSKYGAYREGDKEVMSFEGFEHLLQSLGIGNVVISDHDIDDHKSEQGGFVDFHDNHNHTGVEYSGDSGGAPNQHQHHDGEHVHEHHQHQHPQPDNLMHGDAEEGGEEQEGSNAHHHNDGGNESDVDGADDENEVHDDAHTHQPDTHTLTDYHESDDDDDSYHGDGHVDIHTAEEGTGVTNSNNREEDVTSARVEAGEWVTQQSTEVEEEREEREKRALPPRPEDVKKCFTASEILAAYHIRYQSGIDKQRFLDLCPAIVFQIDEHLCKAPTDTRSHEHAPCISESLDDAHTYPEDTRAHTHEADVTNTTLHTHHPAIHLFQFWKIPLKTWLYALLSITIISLVGLLAVALVPIIQKIFFDHLIQFLVALAIGSLTGDALLHLIPHALIAHGDEGHDHSSEERSQERDAVYKGLVVLSGIYFFLIAERIMAILADYKRNRRAKKKQRGLFGANNREVLGERLRNYSADHGSTDNIVSALQSETSRDTSNMEEFQQYELLDSESGASASFMERSHGSKDDMSHGHGGHGHSHGGGGGGGHQTVSQIAWMVIMGDGLHNFSDGIAIGAAFSNSLTSGFSTSLAVFCHELPHELGDFAVLLKAGMSVKQAIFYNLVSSVLALIGMFLGVCLGNISSASLWIFALAAGMFIYISLVDMLPELQKSLASTRQVAAAGYRGRGHSRDRPVCCTGSMSVLVLHCMGISVGMGAMLLIALYEDKIQIGIGDDVL